MKKVIIIDDEPLAISVVTDYLKEFPGFEIVATCMNGFEGMKAINHHSPDLIFLDIQMPKITGFEMLELIENPPAVIFTTAFDEYAIKAFDAHATDYLLKPFSQERFKKAMNRWSDQNNLPKLMETVAQQKTLPEGQKRIVVKSGNNIRIIPFDEIRFIEAYDDYVKIHIENDCFLKKQTMSYTEIQLGDRHFLRVHRSFIVNLSEITRIEPVAKETYVAILKDQTEIPLSKVGYHKLKSTLGF